MKTNIAALITGFALLALSAGAAEQYTVYTSSGTNYGVAPYVTNSAVISVRGAAPANPVPGNSVPPQPVITFLSVTGDTNTSQVIWYNNAARAGCYMPNTTTTIPVDATNGFIPGQVLLVQHGSNDLYERLVLSSISGGTNQFGVIAGVSTNNLVVQQAPFWPIQAGDTIYAESVAGTIPAYQFNTSITNALTTAYGGTGGAVISGHHGQPLLIEVNGNVAPKVNAASAIYAP